LPISDFCFALTLLQRLKVGGFDSAHSEKSRLPFMSDSAELKLRPKQLLSGKFNSSLMHTFPLKGQCHEIFDPLFFHKSILLCSLIIILIYFLIWFRFCQKFANMCQIHIMRHIARSICSELFRIAQNRPEILDLNFMLSCFCVDSLRNFFCNNSESQIWQAFTFFLLTANKELQ
jgi:hypothetical protein